MCVLTFWGLVRPRDTGKGRGRAWGDGAEVDQGRRDQSRRCEWGWGVAGSPVRTGIGSLGHRSRWQGAGPNPPPTSHRLPRARQQPVSHCPQEAKGKEVHVRGASAIPLLIPES